LKKILLQPSGSDAALAVPEEATSFTKNSHREGIQGRFVCPNDPSHPVSENRICQEKGCGMLANFRSGTPEWY